MDSRTIERADGPDIHAVETGPTDARTLLFVHGISQHHLAWRGQFRSELAEEHHLVAVDLRGHGESETPAEGYDCSEAWAGDIQAVVEGLDLDEVVLVGWSYGSLVALDYLATHGADRVAGAVLVGVVTGVGSDRTDGWLQPGYLDLFPELLSEDVETSIDALQRFVAQCVHGNPDPEDRYLTLGYNAAVPPRVRGAMLDRSVDHLDLLSEVPVPTLLVHGAHDGVVSPEAAEAAHDRLPESTLSVYPDSGHTPFRENPERFAADLRAFLAEL